MKRLQFISFLVMVLASSSANSQDFESIVDNALSFFCDSLNIHDTANADFFNGKVIQLNLDSTIDVNWLWLNRCISPVIRGFKLDTLPNQSDLRFQNVEKIKVDYPMRCQTSKGNYDAIDVNFNVVSMTSKNYVLISCKKTDTLSKNHFLIYVLDMDEVGSVKRWCFNYWMDAGYTGE